MGKYYVDPKEMTETSRCYENMGKTGGKGKGSEFDHWKMNANPT